MGSQSNLIRQDVYKKPPQPQFFNANTRAAIAGTVINSLPSVFMTLAQKVNSNTTKSQEPENTNRAPEDIQADIDNILKDFGGQKFSLISEAETYYETCKATYEKAEEERVKLDASISTLTTTIGNLENEQLTLQGEVDYYENKTELTPDEREALETAKNRIKKIEEELINLNAQKKDEEARLEECQKIVDNKDNLNDMKVKLDNLHKLEAQLKKAEAETTLAQYQQQDCEDVTLILQKLNNAKAKGKTDDVQKYEKELKAKLEELNSNGKLTNGTLKNLAKFYGISVQD